MRVTKILTFKILTLNGSHLIDHSGPNTPTCRCSKDTEHPVVDDGQIHNHIKMDSGKVPPTAEEMTESALAVVMVIHALSQLLQSTSYFAVAHSALNLHHA